MNAKEALCRISERARMKADEATLYFDGFENGEVDATALYDWAVRLQTVLYDIQTLADDTLKGDE